MIKVSLFRMRHLNYPRFNPKNVRVRSFFSSISNSIFFHPILSLLGHPFQGILTVCRPLSCWQAQLRPTHQVYNATFFCLLLLFLRKNILTKSSYVVPPSYDGDRTTNKPRSADCTSNLGAPFVKPTNAIFSSVFCVPIKLFVCNGSLRYWGLSSFAD